MQESVGGIGQRVSVGGGVIMAVVVPVGSNVGLGNGVLLGNALAVGVLLGTIVLVAVCDGPGLGV